MNRSASDKSRVKSATRFESLNNLLGRIEKAVNILPSLSKWDQSEILNSLHQIQVSVRNGGNPKYSVKMLITYCRNKPYLSELADRISTLLAKEKTNGTQT